MWTNIANSHQIYKILEEEVKLNDKQKKFYLVNNKYTKIDNSKMENIFNQLVQLINVD